MRHRLLQRRGLAAPRPPNLALVGDAVASVDQHRVEIVLPTRGGGGIVAIADRCHRFVHERGSAVARTVPVLPTSKSIEEPVTLRDVRTHVGDSDQGERAGDLGTGEPTLGSGGRAAARRGTGRIG